MDKQKISLAGAMLLGAAMSFGAGKLLPDGTEAHLFGFTCTNQGKLCQATFKMTKDGKYLGEKEVAFYFDGRILDGRGARLKGKPPESIAACMDAFKSGKMDAAAGLQPK